MEKQKITIDESLIPPDPPMLLSHTKLGSISQKVMEESLQLFQAREYRVDKEITDIGLNDATATILQELINQTIYLEK